MCKFPITINRPSSDWSHPGKELHPGLSLRLQKVLAPYYTDKVQVPCGKCIECLKKRQNDLVSRCVAEANRLGNVSFLTLTYDEDTVPIAQRLHIIDLETGEVFASQVCELLTRPKCHNFKDDGKEREIITDYVRDELSKLPKSSRSRNISFRDALLCERDVRYEYTWNFTPSLNNYDVQLWLKRCRVNYERKFGVKLPDWSYVICGEYGPRTARPHYHCLFFGLPKDAVRFFESDWREYFGFVLTKFVPAFNSDGSNAYAIASRYVAKYMIKGKYDCDSALCGDSKKSRIMISKGVGFEINEKLLNYYRCYDLYGAFDINTLRFVDGSPLLRHHFDGLFAEIRKRNSIKVGNYDFPLPSQVIRSLWFNRMDDGSFRASQFRRLYSFNLERDFLEDFIATHRNSCDESSAEFLSNIIAFANNQESCKLLAQQNDELRFISQLNKSIF